MRYFFGVGMFRGSVLLSPVLESVKVTDGCPGFTTSPGCPAVTGTGTAGVTDGVTDIGSVVVLGGVALLAIG